MVDPGLDIGLGSDTGGGPCLSMFKEMSNACNMSKANYMVSRLNLKPIDSTFAFYLATMGGAKVLGLSHNVGNFSIGKQADFVVLDAAKVDPLRDNRERSTREILSQITYRENELTIFATFVRGVKIYERNKSHS
jgi:guanine deaminase